MDLILVKHDHIIYCINNYMFNFVPEFPFPSNFKLVVNTGSEFHFYQSMPQVTIL